MLDAEEVEEKNMWLLTALHTHLAGCWVSEREPCPACLLLWKSHTTIIFTHLHSIDFNHTKILGPFFKHHPVLSSCFSFLYTTLSHHLVCCFYTAPCLILFIQHHVSSPCSSFSYTIWSHIMLVVFIHHPILSPCSSFSYTTLSHLPAHHFHTPPHLITLLILFIHHPVSSPCSSFSSFSYTILSHIVLVVFAHRPILSPCSSFS